ncbi:MAG: V-type ATP synthase subunit D [Syntrophales bacterium]|jgi:V/A-type H+-transporting ATPase subunit D|nr:V-type ATP synthase subunit D [Syntrophales bacterium]
MSERIKLSKISLREQKQKLGMYQRFLPALEARKQQLLLYLAATQKTIAEQRALMEEHLREVSTWSLLFRDVEDRLPYMTVVQEVRCGEQNIAGLRVPLFEDVVFKEAPWSLFAMPYSFDAVVESARKGIALREHIRLLEERERILFEGFRKTSQRINLYEQRLIVDCRESIRRISVHLQDQQAAAVGVAKAAKRLSAGN